MNNILITGGAGFVGSHICSVLIEKGYDIFIIDNLKNSCKRSLDILKNDLKKKSNIFEFIEGDLKKENDIREVFNIAKSINKPINAVLHLASLKQVLESQIKPIIYWENNLIGTINLLKIMNEFDCNKIVFSSSATVYSPKSISPITEDSKINPINTYGDTKASVEKLLYNLFNKNIGKNWNIAILRYFNPIGAHPSGLIGENPKGMPTNIFPIICDVALRKRKHLEIFGNDWNTFDGTCIRDYVHIMDIADGHESTLRYLVNNKTSKIYKTFNLGTGKGTSVLELIKTFEIVNKCTIPIKFIDRRNGDIAISFAEVSKAKNVLNWEAKRSLKQMCIDGWNYSKYNF